MGFFKKYKAELIVGSGALLAGVLSFFITLSVYPKVKSNNDLISEDKQFTQLDEIKDNNIIDLNDYQEESNNEDILISLNDISGSITIDTPNVIDSNNDINSEFNEIDESNLIEEVVENVINNESNSNENQEIHVAQNANENEQNDVETNLIDEEKIIEAISKNTIIPTVLPISGDIILEFAKDKLVFSETLNEWITHDGMDIKGEVAEPVKAVADGVIESVKMDPRYGNTIIINHGNNYKTVYSNLSTLELVYAGKQVKLGEIISGVGEGFGFESKEGPHVHFEVIIDGECKNPVNR